MNIESAAGRRRLKKRREPYWLAIGDINGAYVGFRKGPDTWIARLREDDRQHYHQLGRFDDHRSAIRAAREWIRSRDAGVVDLNATVGDACRAYVANREKEKGYDRSRDAKARLQRCVIGRTAEEARALRARPVKADLLSRKPLAKLRAIDIETWRDSLVGEGLTGEALRRARASANRDMAALIAALNHAYRVQMVASNTAWSVVGKFRDVQARQARRYVTLDERRKLVESAETLGHVALSNLLRGLILTGARPIELTRAVAGDYDPRNRTLELLSYKGTSTEARSRQLPLGALKAVALVVGLCEGKKKDEPIFVGPDNAMWPHSGWDHLVREAREAAGIESLTAYDLRHTWITDALTQGVDPMTVARIAGTSLSMITRTYGHLLHDHAEKAFASVESL